MKIEEVRRIVECRVAKLSLQYNSLVRSKDKLCVFTTEMKNTLANLFHITSIFCMDKEFKCYDFDKCFY